MKPTVLYRIASGLLIFFAVSHTVGLFSDAPTTEASAARALMNSAHFKFMGADCSYGQFYVGFGLLFTAYLLFSAYLALYLGNLAGKNPGAIGGLAWAFFMVQLASLALSWVYFFVAPVAVSALVAICLGWAALLVKRRKLDTASVRREDAT
jgi:hypothetical protein